MNQPNNRNRSSAMRVRLLDATPMSRFTILLGGELTPTPRLLEQVAGSRVIAADAGIRHATALRLTPELWVGDFDSVPAGLDDRLMAVERRNFPKEKDKTDGELAVDEALAKGATALLLAGAFGGPRADHAFLHLTLAVSFAKRGVAVMLSSGAQEGLPLLHGRTEFDYPDGTIFSIIAFTDLDGLTVDGALWPLKDARIAFGSSRTISNEVRGRLVVTLGSGRALLIAHPYPPHGF
jgi:thiamine pyrophosphokinase